jgi:hypothetical protein
MRVRLPVRSEQILSVIIKASDSTFGPGYMKLKQFFMKLPSKSLIVLVVFVGVFQLRTFAQSCFTGMPANNTERAKAVAQNNEFAFNEKNSPDFLCNPLQLNGQPLDYNTFSLASKGELTLIKSYPVIGQTVAIPFRIYVRRNGVILMIPEENILNPRNLKIEISKILQYAKEGDQLIIEPANKDDWRAKRILKLLDDGC